MTSPSRLSIRELAHSAQVFHDLGSGSVTSLTTLTPLQRVELTDTYAQNVVKRTTNGDDSVFIVTFMRDENGAWQVEDM